MRQAAGHALRRSQMRHGRPRPGYQEAVPPRKDGLPKPKDSSVEFGGSGETMAA